MPAQLYLSYCSELPSGELPAKIQLIPAGKMVGNDGRGFNNSKPQAILDFFATKQRDIPLDIEHATEIKGPKGEPAPAQGWFNQLEIINGEIWGAIALNVDGEALVSNKNYRYISPAFFHDKQGNIIGISSVGLTNKPNLHLPALNHEEMELTPMPQIPVAIATALALNAETATEQDAVNAIDKLSNDHQLALNRAENPDLDKFVPKETYDLAMNRASTAEGELADIKQAEAEALVDGGVDTGKIAPANREMYVAMCRAEGGIEQVKNFLATAPVIVNDTSQHTKTLEAGQPKLDESQLAMCRQMNVTQEQFLAAQSK